MKIKDLPEEIKEVLFNELDYQNKEYDQEDLILNILDAQSTEQGFNFWYNINQGNFKEFYMRYPLLTEDNIFKKEDLKTGMCVILGSGEVGVFFKDIFANNKTFSAILLQDDTLLDFKDFNDKLLLVNLITGKILYHYSIDEIYTFPTLSYALERKTMLGRKIWKRDIPELSLNQLYEEIGYRFNIKDQ